MRWLNKIFNRESRQSAGEFNALSDLISQNEKALSYHYACIRYFTDLIVTLPIYVRGGGDHYLNGVLNNPSTFFDPAFFYSKLVSNYFQYGQAFAIIRFNEDGGVEDLQLDFNSQVYGESNGLYRYQGKLLLPSQVIAIRDTIGYEFNSISRRRHLSDLESRANDLAILKSALLKTNFSPTLFVSEPHNISKEKEKQFKKAMQDYLQSSSKAKVLPLPHGIDVKNFDTNKKSGEIIPFSDSVKIEIGNSYGIPKALLGLTINLPYQALNEAFLIFLKSSFQPLLARIESAMSFKLLTRDELDAGMKVKFDTSRIQHTDSLKLIDSLSQATGVKPYLFPSEAREFLNLPESIELDNLLLRPGGPNG